MTEPLIAQRGTGLLRVFNDAGVLSAADVHVAERLRKLGGETAEHVTFAAALAVRAVRSGSVCLDVRRMREVTVEEATEEELAALPWPDADEVVAALRVSPLVLGGGTGPLRPLRMVDTDEGELLYLDRYFVQEQTIRRVLDTRAQDAPSLDVDLLARGLDEYFRAPGGGPSQAPDRQRIAAALAVSRWTTVVAGGPGTGKTHTVARVLALVSAQFDRPPRIGLAAPTGKAAARLQEAVDDQAPALGLPDGMKAMTLHRLLGWQRGGTRFRYNPANRLPFDVVVVDETSMVSLTMMCRLLEAMRPDARLILVGDPDQLTSVDAGAVLADLVARPVRGGDDAVLRRVVGADLEATSDPDEAALGRSELQRLRGGVVRLSRGRRFGGAIARLAVAVRDGRDDDVMALLRADDPTVSLCAPEDLAELHSDVVDASVAVTAAADAGDALAALSGLEAHRLLCAHREGPFGVQRWALQAQEWVAQAQGRRLDPDSWYPGQPLLVTANDHELRVYNGDAGVIVARPDGSLAAAFPRGDDALLLHPSQLSEVQTVYAMTIHRSQGSQYDTVSVVLPEEGASLLTRELLYTAITRARRHVRIIGTEESVRAGVRRQVLRASGLRREVRPFPAS
ncbi:exodeoxyribonuclease V subunit alpha [Rhodococcus triatomae]|uniref:RecBCD enzyme subunit RecD n=1 Tax=Rhodococcus triatomae TaxID=300028 RepID=A0A1G8BBT8_9NOCA|nr:exodeoxyribonuclease V subunit alpha [Rhodococcus triatomae]QNG17453.1 exodeoxyribonuclease V subunit alpha [Rhodococcus triatomae]QNG22879.1 exodeoxyribonuclease V subunit alpha [Rhodococcus triatomae]SDH30638.1 DNA helicase/exodeoxyribonuclease V, alpha subunit [Rhodococcus triatomae]